MLRTKHHNSPKNHEPKKYYIVENFLNLIHPSVHIPASTKIGEANVIAQDSFISCNINIGNANFTINQVNLLTINDVTQNEGNAGTSTFTFTVSLSEPAGAGGVTFDIATQDNTATTSDNDYVAKSLTAQTIPAGSSTYTFDVLVNGDIVSESNETFFVNVTNVIGATLSDAGSG